ncbi:MAG: ubiquitin-conjugating enzyme family protein [Candidatus Jordarchaeaceae archaeon]
MNIEYLMVLEDSIPGFFLRPKDRSMMVWKGVVRGPRNTPYYGYEFDLEITIPPLYPEQNPSGRFVTPIYHPNIHWTSLDICLGILNRTKRQGFEDGWSPDYSLVVVQRAILFLLSNPRPEDAYNVEAANLYINDRQEFERRAREYCKMFARRVPTS